MGTHSPSGLHSKSVSSTSGQSSVEKQVGTHTPEDSRHVQARDSGGHLSSVQSVEVSHSLPGSGSSLDSGTQLYCSSRSHPSSHPPSSSDEAFRPGAHEINTIRRGNKNFMTRAYTKPSIFRLLSHQPMLTLHREGRLRLVEAPHREEVHHLRLLEG